MSNDRFAPEKILIGLNLQPQPGVSIAHQKDTISYKRCQGVGRRCVSVLLVNKGIFNNENMQFYKYLGFIVVEYRFCSIRSMTVAVLYEKAINHRTATVMERIPLI